MTHDEKERNLIELLPWIRRTVFVACRHLPNLREDALQEASMAAWVAMDRFDEGRGYQLWTFLRPRVDGAVLDYIRNKVHQFGNNRAMKHRPLVSLNRVVNISDDVRMELGNIVEDYRETPQDRLEAEDAFQELTRGNELLRRLFFDDEEQKKVAEETGYSSFWLGRKRDMALAVIRDRLAGRA